MGACPRGLAGARCRPPLDGRRGGLAWGGFYLLAAHPPRLRRRGAPAGRVLWRRPPRAVRRTRRGRYRCRDGFRFIRKNFPVLLRKSGPARCPGPGRKAAGAAQRRTRAGLLHQGSIQTLDLPARFGNIFAAHLAGAVCPASFDISRAAEELAAEKYDTRAWLEKSPRVKSIHGGGAESHGCDSPVKMKAAPPGAKLEETERRTANHELCWNRHP